MKVYLFIILIWLPTITMIGQPTKEQIQQVEDAKKEVKKMKGKPFPDFELTTMDGEVITKEDAAGKILLINFWFTSCKPCIMEMPEMNEMVKGFNSEEIIFLAPTFDNGALVSKFLDKRDFDYQIIPDVKDFCLEMNVRSYPTHFIVNREGIIEKVIIGYSSMTVRALKKTAHKLLKSE